MKTGFIGFGLGLIVAALAITALQSEARECSIIIKFTDKQGHVKEVHERPGFTTLDSELRPSCEEVKVKRR